jgi:hypothetical protein
VDKEQCCRWLKFRDSKTKTECTILAVQYQALSRKNFKKKNLKEETESKCRLCKEYEEIVDHLTSGCPIFAQNEHIVRYENIYTHLHYSVCKRGNETADNWYSHVPKAVLAKRTDIIIKKTSQIKSDY